MDDLIEPGAVGVKPVATGDMFVDTEAVESDTASSDRSSEYSDEECSDTGSGYSIRNKIGKYGEDSLYTKFAYRLQSLFCIGDDDYFKNAMMVTDSRGNGVVFQESEPLFGVVFGEVTPEYRGITRLTAKGDKSGMDKILPRDRVRWRIGLRVPTEATRLLYAKFNNQLYELRNLITQLEGGEEAENDWLSGGNKIRSWIHPDPETGSENMIQLVTATPVYAMPTGPRAPLQQSNLDPSVEPLSPEDARSAVQKPISLNTVYDASVLEDHVGPAFERHQGTRISQMAFYDSDKNLIPPWETRSALRPGTLILAQVSFRRWNLTETGGRRLHSYQLQVSRIKVVAESPEDIEPYPQADRLVAPNIIAPNHPGFEEFDINPRPHKRRRVE